VNAQKLLSAKGCAIRQKGAGAIRPFVKMHVLILGVDHEIQRRHAWRSDAMKNAYRELLISLIKRHGVQFIGEEALPEWETVGRRLAEELKLPYEWKSIDMPEKARREAGIHEEQSSRKEVPCNGTIQTHFDENGSLYLDLRDGCHKLYPRLPSDTVKEDYFFQQTIDNSGKAKSTLLLCGNLHVEELARRFRNAGHTVTTDAVYNYDWYHPEPDCDLSGVFGDEDI
jgi:hypothetical protein